MPTKTEKAETFHKSVWWQTKALTSERFTEERKDKWDTWTGGSSKNGVFSYSGGTFEVYVLSYSYSWKLETKSSSQARQRQTVYPFRAAQSDLNVTLQFSSMEELRNFGEFARGYHLAVSSSSGIVGSGVPKMTFKLKIPKRKFTQYDSPGSKAHRTVSYGARTFTYGVALPTINVVQANDSVAPTMRLTLKILSGINYDSNASVSWSNKTVTDSVRESQVTHDSVASSGDSAYSYATVNGIGLSRGGH